MALELTFLTIEEVIEAHSIAINKFGGMPGLRDRNALESAVGQARATFGGRYLHSFPFGMAAAYGFHICQAQAFNDGNKRAAALSVIRFLGLNGYELDAPPGTLKDVFLQIASQQMTKRELEAWVSENSILSET